MVAIVEGKTFISVALEVGDIEADEVEKSFAEGVTERDDTAVLLIKAAKLSVISLEKAGNVSCDSVAPPALRWILIGMVDNLRRFPLTKTTY